MKGKVSVGPTVLPAEGRRERVCIFFSARGQTQLAEHHGGDFLLSEEVPQVADGAPQVVHARAMRSDGRSAEENATDKSQHESN